MAASSDKANTPHGERTTAVGRARHGPPTVAIIESHASLAGALHTILGQAGFAPRLANRSGSPRALVSSLVQRGPDVVVLGADLDRVGDGTRLVAPLVQAGLPVVVLAGHADDPVRWAMCLSEGARAVVRRTVPLDEFLRVLREVVDGSYVPPPDQQALRAAVEAQEYVEHLGLLERVSRLTSRERQVLVDLTRGLTAAEVAVKAFVSEATVRSQIQTVLRKLEVSSQLAAVAIAHLTGVDAELLE